MGLPNGFFIRRAEPISRLKYVERRFVIEKPKSETLFCLGRFVPGPFLLIKHLMCEGFGLTEHRFW